MFCGKLLRLHLQGQRTLEKESITILAEPEYGAGRGMGLATAVVGNEEMVFTEVLGDDSGVATVFEVEEDFVEHQ